LPHIFERFYRVDKARARKQGGTGLGLPIARTIVQAHGGRIEAQSHVGEGTKMSLHLALETKPEQGGRTANLGARDRRTWEQDHA
jgi:two-component system sensor histidine kinase VicK